jgi:uncharacterized protein (TIGR01244 family)
VSAAVVARAALVAAAVAAFCAPASGSAAVPQDVEPEDIPNYLRVRPDFATGGAPTAEGLERLREFGFAVVVDLREPSEETDAERARVEAAGLRYVSIPVAPETLSWADVDRVKAVIDDPARGPLLLHCASGNRVGGVWVLLEAAKGVPFERALHAGRAVGLRSETMVEAVRRVAASPRPGR